MRLTHLDLFSGIGGFSLAAEKAGFETIGFSEVNPFCNEILKKHWPHVKNYGDIKELNFNDHVTLITGGFPCQPFSVAGKRRGKADERYLWNEYCRIITGSRPCWVIIENVAGLVSMALDDILIDLETAGYTAWPIIIPACAANAPHRRERLWIIANCPSVRCEHCHHNREARYLQDYKNWNLPPIQQKWEEFKPLAWETHTASDWLQYNATVSRGHDGIPRRMDRIKALGNAIVPQVAFPILSGIKNLEEARA